MRYNASNMSWKVFALLESSFCVLLSVVSVIFLLFVMTANGGTGIAEPIAIVGIIGAMALTLVAHGQLIGSFRRRAPGQTAAPRPGSLAIPALTVLVVVGDISVLLLDGHASWHEFARVYITYALVPPAALALASRALVVLLTRRPSSESLI